VPLLKDEPRLVVLRTFSKAMSLAGLRFGYALAHPAVAAEIAKARLPYNVNRVTLAAAHAALDAADVLAERARAVRLNRDALAGRLARIPGLRAFPSAANFVLIRCVARPAAEVFRRLVEEHGILLGQALSQALGERRGIRRYGDATVPLDDALARVVVDVSGRPYLAYHADPPTWQKLGDYDVALTPEFFRALATHGGLTL